MGVVVEKTVVVEPHHARGDALAGATTKQGIGYRLAFGLPFVAEQLRLHADDFRDLVGGGPGISPAPSSPARRR
jgi:hypothetical protein